MASSDHTILQFSPSSTSISAKVHPLVIFNICDCFVRRPDQADRIIGTLLGSVLPDGTVDIRNSYAVPHTESQDQVALEIDYHHNMLSSHQKVNPKEVIVGWNSVFQESFLHYVFGRMSLSGKHTVKLHFVSYFCCSFEMFIVAVLFSPFPSAKGFDRGISIGFSTGFGVTGGSALIHDFFSRETTNPIHLTIDTGFTNGEASVKGFVSVHLSIGDQQLAAQFQEIPLDLRMVEAERIGFDILKTTAVEKLPNDLEGMEASMQRLLALIDDIYKYVDDVVEGRVPQDNKIGRFISDTVASLPKLSPQDFDKLVNDGLEDQLLLLYLASLTRTQLSFAEKLNTAAQIL
ncbi:hypothetical protein RDI58_026625 [Solanum bulbocastanum]|uniref:Eukaryotic translation initiation factor 3 subunit F n=1 Tax=Solanum bulbocastanum TaxID=147425 RepID=A0AAN8SX96_SOLBU